ncbi:MAG: thiamine pyrophosphate-dependent dehydrogenase E1 component subunit alpha, partial [Opitutaceae bacterium]
MRPAPPAYPGILKVRDLSPGDLESRGAETRLAIYAWMHFARAIDNRILELFRQGLIKGTVTGGQGNEAMIVPLALLADKTLDVVSFTHRGLGGHLIWSGHLCGHLNQYFANADSPTHAREGNIHHGDPANRSLPMISHLGSMCGPVLGVTDSQRRLGRSAVGFVFFGDGGSSTGDIHEALNLASLLSVPVVFVIENNGYAYSTPAAEQYRPGTELWQRAAGYGIEGLAYDGTDPEQSLRVFGEAIAKARASSRPILIEARTLRLRGHAAYDTCDYLPAGAAEAFAARDPLPRYRERVVESAGADRVLEIEAELHGLIEACVKLALAVDRPAPGTMEADVFAPAQPPRPWRPTAADPAAPTRAGAPEP